MTRPVVTVTRLDVEAAGDEAIAAARLEDHLDADMADRHLVVVASDSKDLPIVIDAVLRGASMTLLLQDIDLGRDVLDELGRIAVVTFDSTPSLDAVSRALLDLLAAGASTEEAARRVHISTRSAYRVLAAARATLGVTSNSEAMLAIRQTNQAR